MDTLEIGEIQTLEAAFQNAAGVAADPTLVTLTITAPDASVTVVAQPALTHVAGTGVYSYNLTVTQAGIWSYRFDGTGTIVAGETDSFLVVAVSAGGGCAPWLSCWENMPCDPDWTQLPSGISEAEAQALIIGYVSDMLWRLSCEQYGVCTVTARPIRACEHDWSGCTCGRYEYLILGAAPIVSVAQVKIDGAVFPAASYRVDEFHRLVRLDGDPWPYAQDMLEPTTAADTWSVTWTYGVPPPPEATLMAGLYACQVAENLTGGDCELPPGTTSVSREGVSVQITDTAAAVAGGKTGVHLIDLWLETVCPGGPSKALSGGMDLGLHRTYVRTT